MATTLPANVTSFPIPSSALRLPAKLAALVEGDDRLTDLPVCSVEARARLQITLDAEHARPMTTRDEVDTEIGTLALVLPKAATSDAEGEAYLAAMAAALDDMPVDLFKLACQRALREARFLPTPAELTALVRREVNARRWRMSRMKLIAERHDREGPPALPIALVDGDEVRELVVERVAALTRRGEAVPPALVEPVIARRIGEPAREPSASDYAAMLGISEEEAAERMKRGREDTTSTIDGVTE